jgi:hypothetical protein
MEVALIVPLQKTEAGKPYTRIPIIETRLTELSSLSDGDLVDLCKQSRAHPKYVPSECLLYFVRRCTSTKPSLLNSSSRFFPNEFLGNFRGLQAKAERPYQ